MLKLRPESLDWALKHVQKYGDTDVLHSPFEYDAIAHDWDTVRGVLANEEQTSRATRQPRFFLAPKGRFTFRVITQLDPLDLLTYTALVKEIADPLEASRLPTALNRVFSSRYLNSADGSFFDPRWRFAQFDEAALAKVRDDRSVSHVVVADIADFYPRVYLHRLENALDNVARDHPAITSHVSAINRMLLSWNAKESIGIPVGSAATRLLAEVLLSGVDLLLRAEDINFIRYVDDYRLYCTSRDAAYRALVRLAETLHTNHRLFLQPQKTSILTRDQYLARFGVSERDRELASLRERFAEIVPATDGWDPYEPLEYENLTPAQKAQVDSLNLHALLEEALDEEPEPNYAAAKFILARLTQLADVSAIELLLVDLDRLYPVLPSVVRYLRTVAPSIENEPERVAATLLEILETTALGALPYHRALVADMIASSSKWKNADRVLRQVRSAASPLVKREFILALRHSPLGSAWFQEQWRDLNNFDPWTKRALLAGAVSLPRAGRKAFVTAWRLQDPLERAVADWVGTLT